MTIYNILRGDSMILQEKMKLVKFSPSEKTVINFILDKQELIDNYSTTQIADETYTTPSILIRIAKKFGFSGYSAFKKAYLKEVRYLKTNFQHLDANKPFNKTDTIMTIANKITQLKQESLNDTLSLIHHDSLQEAIHLLEKSNRIRVFTVSNLAFQAEEFVFKMRHIGKQAETFSLSNTLYQEAVMSTSGDCAICLSYSGESNELLTTMNYLKENNIPIIAITSIVINSLSNLSDITLQMTTREKSYTKIGSFTSLESISLLLDILYACFFALSYDTNYTFKTTVSKITEHREIDNRIIKD